VSIVGSKPGQPRLPALDFAFFPISLRQNGRPLGWEVTMLDVEILSGISRSAAEQHSQSMPLLIGEVTELLEGPVLKSVVDRQLKLWLPVSYGAFDDAEWINAMVEQLSGPAELRRGVVFLVYWNALPPPKLELRSNIDRLRLNGICATDTTASVAMVQTYRGVNGPASFGTRSSGTQSLPTKPSPTNNIDEVIFGTAVSLASVLRELR
jgi:hypothetical protein